MIRRHVPATFNLMYASESDRIIEADGMNEWNKNWFSGRHYSKFQKPQILTIQHMNNCDRRKKVALHWYNNLSMKDQKSEKISISIQSRIAKLSQSLYLPACDSRKRNYLNLPGVFHGKSKVDIRKSLAHPNKRWKFYAFVLVFSQFGSILWLKLVCFFFVQKIWKEKLTTSGRYHTLLAPILACSHTMTERQMVKKRETKIIWIVRE